MSSIKFTILFESPFWVGIIEREDDGKYSVARKVFGAEPANCEIFEFVINNMEELRFTTAEESEVETKKINPKRFLREIRREIEKVGVASKAQEALRLEQEKNKKEKRTYNRNRKEEEKQERFELKQQKKKEKKRGH